MVKRNAVLTTLALAVAGFVPLAAQEPSRAELEEQLRQLQTEVRELQRRLNEQGRTETRIRTVTPRALVAPRSTGMAPLVRISTNRAMLGVTVRTERSARVDSIGAELTAVTPVEVLRDGPPTTPERYSLLLRLTLQSQEATLTEADLAGWSARIIECLEKQLGAQIRM